MYLTELREIPSDDLLILPMRRGPHWSDAKVLARLQKIFKEGERRGILHTHSTKAGIFGAALRPWIHRSLFTPHAYRSVDPNLPKLKRIAIQAIERTFSNTYDRVIAVAPAEYEHAIRLGVDPERMRHIPNGIRLDHYPEAERSDSAKNMRKSPTLGFVGRLAPQKNPLLFLEVVRDFALHHPDVRALVVGDGILRAELQASAERFGIADRIDWKGAIPATSVFPQMDILIHTSHYEGMPYTLIESAAFGIPVVATRNAGSVAILADFLPEAIVDSFESISLVKQALLVCDDSVVRDNYFSKLKKIADKFSLDSMVNDLITEYEQLSK